MKEPKGDKEERGSGINVRAASRTLDLFEAFATIRRPMTVSELARVLKVPVSSCFAIIRTLEGRGYLFSMAPGNSFYPTSRLSNAAEEIIRADPVLSVVGDAVRQLRDEAGETAMFGKLCRNRVILLAVEISARPSRYMPQVGDLRPVHATAIGKALLGSLPDDELDKTLSRLALEKLTRHTIADVGQLKRDLAASRRRGWYVNAEETVADMTSLCVPLRLRGEHYALAIAGPSVRIKANLEDNLDRLATTAKAISSN
ncbi:IclR family transcriptional regulator [Vineibacter terrae]|uniref:IclR family transcriptional regulator n=1 Tax=Vineibacter terrae TaxID=2586908 RepID=A0A5C8PUE2_9HYPH|nr:IclR family transcriptional regulator [Vineibacter terrae]TXL81701.1 IclR family transcriptional regulator [Vineibacter terrae]